MPAYSFRLRCSLIALAASIALPAMLAAQPTTGVKPSNDESILKKSDLPSRASTLAQNLPPIERQVDPESYRVGPNDQLTLVIPQFEGGEYPIIVSLDNTIVLPRGFPLLDVKGMTLARLRDVVDSLYRSRSSSYRNIGLSLVKPRSIYVTVSGDVLFPDRYILTAADRPTTAIDIANKVSESSTKEQEAEAAALQRAQKNARNGLQAGSGLGANQIEGRWVTLRHNDGTVEKLDLLHYRAFGDDADNPTLREGDEVIVQPATTSGPTVAVVGAVHTPAIIPYSSGDNALMLARLAGGSADESVASEAYISRHTGSGLDKIPVDLNDATALAGVKLQPGDQLIVTSTEQPVTGGGSVGVVSVLGEVARPSTYPIIPGVTTLSDVIAAAGGPSADAALAGASITRASGAAYQPMTRLLSEPGRIIATSSLQMDDTLRMQYDIENQRNLVSADFVDIIAHGDKARDVKLENGDQIVIPQSPRHVYIRGRVSHPGWVDYVAGADLDYYIDRVGGYTDAAAHGRVQLLKYGTGIWEDPSHSPVNPGDEIYVPGERDSPARTPLEIAGTILGITSAVVSIAYSIFAFVRDLRNN